LKKLIGHNHIQGFTVEDALIGQNNIQGFTVEDAHKA
jgi:hypothetical protein